ncbi:MAG TPA: CRISPR-associated helicase Cas3' [Candidatus Lokiarchaeia archaeon]|nr:CRISPR-associated helicase Cas3' [Candidatus Lokiarchaeia archaeon]
MSSDGLESIDPLSLWGKLRSKQSLTKKNVVGEEIEPYHPLVFHLIDTMEVIDRLWDEITSPGLKELIKVALNADNLDDARLKLCLLGTCHDMGKILPDFQTKWDVAKKFLVSKGIKIPNNMVIPHGTGTTILMESCLQDILSIDSRLATIIGGHHGAFPLDADVESMLGRIKIQPRYKDWITIAGRTLKMILKFLGIDKANLVFNDEGWRGASYFIAGLISVSDWLASMEDHFPFTSPSISIPEYLDMSRSRAEEALIKTGWIGIRPPSQPLEFKEMLDPGKQPRPLQDKIVELSTGLASPGIVLVEAPMGEGKTEAALYMADAWQVAGVARGIYFALPTQATSNQMFGRVGSYLAKRYIGETVVLSLVHGHASLSSELALLTKKGAKILVPGNLNEAEGYDGAPAGIVASEWFSYRKRGLLSPFGVGTIDQALLSVLQTKHFFVRMFGLAGKVVIFDEIHAYDVYMSTILQLLIEWLAASGCAVVLLSATVPKSRRKALLDAYRRGLISNGIVVQDDGELDGIAYPRVSWILSNKANCAPVDASRKVRINLSFLDSSLPDTLDDGLPFEIATLIDQKLAQGGVAAVICNTVGRAQAVYKGLRSYFKAIGKDIPVTLFHAHFTFEDRDRIEKRILNAYGKPDDAGNSPDRPPSSILVSTQVIEQSLDIDFDFMITDLAPIDLLLQRSGRLQRHDRTRPGLLSTPEENPNLAICRPSIDPDDGENLIFGARNVDTWVYDQHVLLRTWILIRELTAISLPSDMDDLIEFVYGDTGCPDNLEPDLIQAWIETFEEMQAEQERNKALSRNRCIHSPSFKDDILQGLNMKLEEENPEIHADLQAATRISGPTIPVVILYETDQINASNIMDVKKLLERSMTISHRGIVPVLKGMETPRAWTRNPLLRHHKPLILDANSACEVGNYLIVYDPELGLTITKQDKKI